VSVIPLRVPHNRPSRDLPAAERAAAAFLTALGMNLDRLGTLRDDARSRTEFFTLAGLGPR
jgi:GTP cyclohydrolase I